MNEILSTLLILTLKLILLVGFVYLIKLWLRKKNNIQPILAYWVLGLFFVLMQAHQISNWILFWTFHDENSLIWDLSSINTLSAIIGIVIYVIIGVKYFKKKN